MPQLEELILHADVSQVAHLGQYFGVWAIQPEPFRAAVQRIGSTDLALHISSREAGTEHKSQANRSYALRDSIAEIEITGPMMKFTSSLSGGSSTVRARHQIRQAVRDPDVSSILLRIDSPGGTVSGTADLAADIAEAAKHKPVHAYIEDLGASAAYWIASQATKVYANATALVGSIGTYMAVADFSKAAEMEGVKVHVLKAGEFKGTGVIGTEVTDAQLEYLQGTVDDLNAMFLKGVSTGRAMKPADVKKLADGRVHIAKSALALGLIDGVKTLDETIAGLRSGKARAARAAEETPPGTAADHETEDQTMTDTTKVDPAATENSAATLEQLKAACPGADAAFLLSQLEGKATVAQATGAFLKAQQATIAAQQAELDAAKTAKPGATDKAKAGVEALGTKAASKSETALAEETGDAVAEFNAAVAEKVKGGMDRRKATIAVAKSNPELHQAFLLSTNPGRKKQALIADRFDVA